MTTGFWYVDMKVTKANGEIAECSLPVPSLRSAPACTKEEAIEQAKCGAKGLYPNCTKIEIVEIFPNGLR